MEILNFVSVKYGPLKSKIKQDLLVHAHKPSISESEAGRQRAHIKHRPCLKKIIKLPNKSGTEKKQRRKQTTYMEAIHFELREMSLKLFLSMIELLMGNVGPRVQSFV